jgi:uncharacterized repeat protein (TIGR01451 family)
MKLKKIALIVAASTISVSAYAQTEYNLDITNTANLSYTSGTNSRTATSNQVTFVVDRKVIFNLSGTNPNQNVTPGDTTYSTYTLTNTSNAPIDYKITAPTAGNVTFIIDDDGTPGVSPLDTRVTNGPINPTDLDPIELTTADGATPSIDIYVEIITSATAVDGDTTNYALQATAVEPVGSAVGTPGSDIVPTPVTTVWDPAAVQTVVDNSAANANNQGIIRTGSGAFTVGAAVINLEKTVKILSDPITGNLDVANSNFPKAIPGAVVEYTLTVKNTGTAPATVELTDLLSENFLKDATLASVKVDGIAPTPVTATLAADSTTTDFDELLTIPEVTVEAFDSVYQSANPTATEASSIVTFEVVLK